MKTNLLFNRASALSKRLAMLLTMLFTIGVGSMLGATASFAPSNFSGQGTSGTGSAISATVDGVTFACDKGYGTSQFRCYKGSKITISSSNTIIAISFTFSSNSYTGGLSDSYTDLSTNSWEQTLSSQARITECVVTYKEASTAPCTVTFHTTATAETPLTEASAGDGVTPPEMEEICGDWEFMGWSESFSESETSTTELELVTLTDDKYYPTADVDLYPVYTKTEGGGGSTEETLSQTLQYDTWSYSGSTTDKSSYRLFHSGSYVESSEFDLSTLSKVVVYGGTFGGSSYNKLTIAGVVGTTKTTWKSVTVSGSSQTGTNTYTDGTSLSGIGKLRVTSNSGSSSSSGVRISKIMIYTLQATSTIYYYSYPQCTTETVDCSLLKFITDITENYTATYTQNVTATELTVAAKYDNGSTGVTYQWYSNATNSITNGTPISGAISASYTPLTTTTGTTYYYCVATYDECTITSNVATVTITAPVPTFTVTFDSDGGSAVASQTIEEGNKAIKPEDPTKKGYDFVGWYNGNTEFDFDEVITGDITLTAKWNIITYYITYEGLEDATHSNPSTYDVETATITFTAPSNREGYVFKGWTPATIDKGSTGDKTVTATWAKVYTITWMVGGNEYTTGSPTTSVESNQKISSIPDAPDDNTLADCGATKFMGWSTDNIGSTPDADAPTDLFTTVAEAQSKIGGITENKTFYAVFATAKTDEGEDDVTTTFDFTSGYENATAIGTKTQDGVTITFGKGDNNSNKPTYYDSGNAVRVYAKNTITVACTGLTKITFTFGNDDGSNTITANTGSFTSPTWTGTANSVKFTIGGSSGNRRIQKVAVTYTATTSITTYSNYVTNCCTLASATNLTVSGTTANSATLTWTAPSSTTGITKLQVRDENGNVKVDNLAANATTATITGLSECTEYTFCIASVGDECELTSQAITAQPFSGAKTVTFNPNGGSVSPTSETTSCTNQSIELPTPTYSGYRFMGWFNAASDGTKIGEAGASYTPSDDITLFAHWAKEYTVTYNANGGSTTCANGNYIEGETVTLCTSTPSKTGYTFAGWTYSPEVTITDGKFTMPANNVIITAQWTINQYTVTWNPNGGKWGESTADIVHTYDYGATINRPADPTREGCRFIGWNETVASTMPATNITYTAQWKQNYTITFHDGDDTTPWTQTADAESIDLNTYVGTHACGDYNFAGWSTDATIYDDEPANITTWVTDNYTPTANIDLYAVYTKGAVTNDFTLNCAGGVYEIWENGTGSKYHMAGQLNDGHNLYTTDYWDNNKQGPNLAPFTITKVADNTYTLQNAAGQYITGTSSSSYLYTEDSWNDTDGYKWTISNGTNGTWRFTNKVSTNYALIFYDKYFQLRKATNVTFGSDYYDLELTPAQTNVYQSNPNCGPYYIIFNTHGGEFIQGDEYPYGKEKTGLTETTDAKFPAAELEGYTFAGWKDGSPQEDINYEPYLKKAGDNLVVSSNKTYHAVYYYYDEEEEIDWSEEFTTGMYAEVNGTKYFLSGTPDRGTMSSTTDCGYVSEVTITPGTGANAGKYKITVNDVVMAPVSNEADLEEGTFWWTITETSSGSGQYEISGQENRNIVLRNTSFGHYAYNAQGSYNGPYYYPSFGKCLEHHWTSNPPIKLTVTYDPNGATSGTAPIDSHYYMEEDKVSVLGSNGLQKENYAFGGWNTQADGEGDNYEEGEDFTITGNTTLYAKWDCATYVDITKGTPVNGTFNLSVTGTQYTCENGFVVSVTDIVPATGYRFDHITQDGVDAANVMIDNNAQTVTYDKLSNGSSTINVVFVAIPYTVTWDPNGGNWGGNTDDKVVPYEYGATIIEPAAPTRTGYTFAGWSPAPAATMPADNQTYTAQWNCVAPTIHIEGEYIHFPGDDMTLTVMGDNIADDATYVWKQGETLLPDQTTATLTINHCDVTHAGNYVCTVTNGSCSAEANFTVKIFHLYGLKDNSWTQPYVFMRDAEANKAILYVDLDAATSYEFKLINGREWYWNEGTMTYDNCTDWDMPQEGDVKYGNTWITTTVAGTYAFKLDYTDAANLKLSVVYPQKKMVYLNPGPWDVAGAKFAVHTWIGENGADLFMEKVDDCTDRNIYQAEIDASHANIIFVRVNPAISNINQLWENEWNRTSDLTLPTDENVLYDMTSLYLTPNLWNSNGAWFAAYFYGNGETWKKMTDSNGDGIYECEKVAGYPNVIFCRMDPAKSDLAWGSVWNQTGDLTIPTQVNNHFIVPDNNNAWNKPGDNGNWSNTGMWTTFTPYHTISYNMNGHGIQISDECIKEGNTWSAPTDPTEVGYTFQGWRRPAATGDSKLYKNGQTGYKPTASETLTAQWQINQCVVTWKVNAQEVAKTIVDIANPLTTIPYTPADDALGCCAEKFIGWSTETNPTKNQVYTTASELQDLIGTLAANTTKTFHAVFATPVPGAGNSLVTFNEMGYGNEEAVASVTLGDGLGNGDATITFAKGTAATYVPTYYNIGEAVRTYAGNTITVAATYANTVLTQIDFAFAKGENANAITASTGTITDGVWTGNAQSVTFTISGATGHRRIASIAITTAVTGDQYTNYVTKCDLSGSASIGAGTITYAVGNAIEVKCGQRSPASKAATLTFASAQDLTCPVTIEASAGFLVSTNKNDNSKYASSITVKPVKTGTNKGKLPTIYVRAEANFGVSGQMNGTITASGDEITTTQVNVVANVTCTQYTLTVVDHLGNTISTTQYYEGDEVAEVDAPATDDCSKDYTFDGWSETSVEYGSLIYNKVSFPFTMPANDVTLYPVYVCSKDYHRVTEDLGIDNWEGQYLIAHSNTEFANGYQGGTTDGNCIGGTNSVRDLSQYITNDVVSKDCDIRSVKLIAVNGGYVLQTRDGKYNYITASAPSGLTANDNLSTADDHPLTIIFNSETDIAITNLANVNQASLQYSATYFRFYKPGNQEPVYLYKKYLYTTPLICGTIEAEDAVVTSTADQTIKVNVPITITSTLGGTTNITAESDNDHFTVTPLENVATGEHTIAVHYTPDATTDGTEIANITLTASHGNRATTTFQVTGRHLPENFVIAAKWGENWYVLPADISSESITEGLLIEVDDPSNPTKALAAPNTTKYGLKSVYTTSGVLDRYKEQGENLVFVENITGNNKTLYNAGGDAQNSTNTNIQVYAQYKTATSGYYETNPERYEWTPTTTDLKDYTLTSAHTFATEAARTVSLDNHGIFGTLLQDKSYNGMVRLLPVDNFYEPIELQVVEWKENSVSVMYTGAGTKYTTQVSNNAESSVLAAIDHAVYSLSTADLTTTTNQPLIITIKDDADAIIGAVKLTIPAIVATDKSSTALGVTEENAKATSIVVLDGATLTADATKYTYDDIIVYPGGKLVIGQNGQLGMYTLTLRAGSSWGAAEYEHKYPQFVLNNSATDAYNNSSAQINLDYVTTKEQYYTFVAPFDVKTKDIKYPVDIYGSNVTKANSGSFEFQYYDGESRAAGSPGWKVVEEGAEGATLKAGQGYTFLGMPKKIDGTRQKYGIHRIPMKVAAGTAQSHETVDQTVPLSVHLSAKNNNSGWNLVGNPYMSNVANLSNNDIQVGELVHTNDANGNWTGGWHWDDPTTGQRFLVIPSNDGKSYEAVQASHATLSAFKNFFVQISNESANAMSIPVANRVERNLAPARYAEAQPERDVEVAIVLEQDEAHSDQLDFLLNDMYSAAFDFNGDFTKMMNATNLNIYGVHTDDNLSFIAIDQHTAQESIPIGYQVPAAGEYTLRISDKPYVMWNEIDALYVTDHEMSPEVTVDLLHAPYEFSVNQAETNNERFTVSVRVKAKTENGATGLGNVGADGEQIHKFIYQDKMYILHHGIIYDATGKRVITINK